MYSSNVANEATLVSILQTFARLDGRKKAFYHDRTTKEYPFIPLSVSQLERLLTAILKTGRKFGKFLDVGCGVGWVPTYAALLSGEPHCNFYGLEKNKQYELFGTHLLEVGHYNRHPKDKPKSTWIHGDMLKFNRYGEFDTIYFYVPIADHNLMVKFWNRMLKQLKPDTLIISVGFTPPLTTNLTKLKFVDNRYGYEGCYIYNPVS